MTDLVETVARVWLNHQGFTDADLALLPEGEVDRHTHERLYGCEFDWPAMQWDCTDEHGQSNHPVWDAVVEAGEMANVLIEALGLTEHRRLVTPQGTSRPLRPHEGGLGDKLRSLGWRIERQYLSDWVLADG